MGSDIVVIGSASIDYNVLTDRLPAVGETVLGSRFWTNCGGKGANQAVGAARLGGRVSMIVRVGQDDQGRIITDNLRDNGVDTSLLTVDSESASGTAHIFVAQGKNQIVVVPAANGRLSASDIDRALPTLAQAKLVMLQLEIPIDSAIHAVQQAKRSGAAVMLDPAPAVPLPESLYSLVDYCTPNETEASVLTGVAVTDHATARLAGDRLRQWGVRHPVMKLGERGCVVWTGTTWADVPAFPVNSVDSVAAGDAFAAGLAVALSEGRPLVEAARFAAAAGALATTEYGAMPSLPRRQAVDQLLAGTR